MPKIEDWTFGEQEAADVEGRLGDYLGGNGMEDLLGPAGLGVVPVSLGTPEDPMSQHEGPDTDAEGDHLSCGKEVPEDWVEIVPDMEAWTLLASEDWSFVAEGERESAMHREILLPVKPSLKPSEEIPEPPPPSQVRRMLSDRMRELGRGLMIAGSKAPRQQMMEIQHTMVGLLEQLEALSDQPGREALRRRILLQLRPRVMRF